MDVEIRELVPALVDDFLRFFDRDAFPDNPEWAACYCHFWHHGGSADEWNAATAEENRAAMAEHIRRGHTQGLLAYADGRPVGWCQASRPRHLTSLGRWMHRSPGEDTGCITCFVVTPAWRRRGLAARLLDGALAMFRAARLAWAEAYPNEAAVDDAAMCSGPLALYLRAGFQLVGPLATTNPPLAPRQLVRLRLV